MTTKLVIRVIDEATRSNWKSLADVKKVFTEQEIFEMVQRYQDTQKHAVSYRERAKVKNALMKERLAELERAEAERLLRQARELEDKQ